MSSAIAKVNVAVNSRPKWQVSHGRTALAGKGRMRSGVGVGVEVEVGVGIGMGMERLLLCVTALFQLRSLSGCTENENRERVPMEEVLLSELETLPSHGAKSLPAYLGT